MPKFMCFHLLILKQRSKTLVEKGPPSLVYPRRVCLCLMAFTSPHDPIADS